MPELYVDYWLLPKSYALTGLLVVMAVLVALKLFLGKRERVFCRIFVPLLVYIAMMILSSVFSVVVVVADVVVDDSVVVSVDVVVVDVVVMTRHGMIGLWLNTVKEIRNI